MGAARPRPLQSHRPSSRGAQLHTRPRRPGRSARACPHPATSPSRHASAHAQKATAHNGTARHPGQPASRRSQQRSHETHGPERHADAQPRQPPKIKIIKNTTPRYTTLHSLSNMTLRHAGRPSPAGRPQPSDATTLMLFLLLFFFLYFSLSSLLLYLFIPVPHPTFSFYLCLPSHSTSFRSLTITIEAKLRGGWSRTTHSPRSEHRELADGSWKPNSGADHDAGPTPS